MQQDLTNIEAINFIFGGGLLTDAGRKPFNFEKNHRRVRACVCVCVCVGGGGGPNFGPNDKR